MGNITSLAERWGLSPPTQVRDLLASDRAARAAERSFTHPHSGVRVRLVFESPWFDRVEAPKHPSAGRSLPLAAIEPAGEVFEEGVEPDFLAVEVDARALLPPDDEDKGFDTIANALTISPTLMKRYMKAARQVSQLAVGDPGIRPVAERYPISRL